MSETPNRSEPEPKPGKDGSFGALLRPVRGKIIGATVLEALAAQFWLVPFVAIYDVAERATGPTPDTAGIWSVVLVTVASILLRLVLQGLAVALSHRADTELQLHLRRRMVDRLGRVPLGWFTERNSGRVKSALHDDIDEMHYVVAHALPDFAAAALIPVTALLFLIGVDWRLTLVTLVTLPLFVAGYLVMARVAGRRMPAVAEAMQRLNAAIVEFVQGIAVVKTFGQGRRGHQRFTEAADGYANAFGAAMGPLTRLQVFTTALLSPVVMLLATVTGGAVFLANGWLEPVKLIPFVTLTLALTTPIVAMSLNANSFKAASAAASRVKAVLDTPVMTEPERPREPDGARVEFDGVSFAYDQGSPVLHEVSAVLEPGTTTALVGPSGAGKSTMAALVPRFFDVVAGQVRIGGVDVREMSTEDLYRTVGFVFQDVLLLRASVTENLRLAKPSASDAELEAAARAAHIHDRITALPRGYDSVIGEDALLSGGEAQRLSIARALLADTPVLVLDEATAYADPQSEADIQDALSLLVADRTLLIIAHRLATVAGADQILVLDGGRVVERGRHADLVDAGGLYQRLWHASEEHRHGPAMEVKA